ncbi:MAG: hypothetical protein AAGA60_00620 [Cyanobacteria bacterium P01_E01_bin.42]
MKVTELTDTLAQLQQSQLPQVQKDVRALLNLVQLYHQHYPEPIAAIQTELDRLDLEALHEELPQTLDSLTLSSDRLEEIARSLNHFFLPDALDFD